MSRDTDRDDCMKRDLSALFACRDLRSYPLSAMHMIMGARLCILFGQAGRDPLPDLAVRLRSMNAARRVAQLVQTIQQVWPEHFLIHRPCAMALSPDETLLGDLAVAAAAGDEETARLIMRDMLPEDISRLLFADALGAASAIQAAQMQSQRPAG